MPLDAAIFQLWLPAWVLIAARVAGVVLALPMFSSVEVPNFVKIVLVVSLAAVAFPLALPSVPQSLTLTQALVAVFGELALGELVGLSAGAVLHGATLAGHLVAQQSGLAIGSVFNPLYDSDSTVLEQVWFYVAALLFIGLRGHLALIHAVLGSFQQVPPGALVLDGQVVDHAVAMLDLIFDLALRLAGPAILALLLTTIALGFLARTMPQLNMLSVGFSFKIVIALGVCAWTMSIADDPIGTALWDGLDAAGAVLEHAASAMRGGA